MVTDKLIMTVIRVDNLSIVGSTWLITLQYSILTTRGYNSHENRRFGFVLWLVCI